MRGEDVEAVRDSDLKKFAEKGTAHYLEQGKGYAGTAIVPSGTWKNLREI